MSPGKSEMLKASGITREMWVLEEYLHQENTTGDISQVKPLADVTREEVERIRRINVQSGLRGTQAAEKLRALKGKGKIINPCCPGVVGTDMWVMARLSRSDFE